MKKNPTLSSQYIYGFHTKDRYVYKAKKGLDRSVVEDISRQKNEPEWMREFRLDSFEQFLKKPMPSWGPNLSGIDLNTLCYYLKPMRSVKNNWKNLPKSILETYQRIGVPEAEKKFLSGVSAQYESEVVYKSLQKTLSKKGVIFVSMDDGLKQYPEIVKRYLGSIIPPQDNKFAALNSSVWSGGTFLYVPKNVRVDLPLQAYFRINAENLGQFERTLIIADEGSYVHYIEGCTAPIYSTDSLHAGVVEVLVKKGARVRYSTVQNWSTNVYNLVTKRAKVEEEGVMEWVDGNIGSKLTMKYPATILAGYKARGEVLSVSYAGEQQLQDTGAKMIHLAPGTTSRIIAKSICQKGGRASFRGYVRIGKNAKNAKSSVSCQSLLLDKTSRADTYPSMEILNHEVEATHEATVSRIEEDQLFYLQSRGIPKDMAESLIVNGFIEPIVKELPLEYAVELNKLIAFQMEHRVG
jgi:Fe-S cluster assembly protein SufB